MKNTIVWMGVAVATAALTACGGGGGGAPSGPARFTLAVNVVGSGSVSSSPAGISCGTTCSAAFDVDTRVTLTATPSSGHTLQGWGGACSTSGASSSCTVAMTQAASATVTFAAPPSSGWSSPAVALSAGASGSAKVVMDNSGRALAAWLTLRPGTLVEDDLVASRYEPGSGWSTPV
ncbi:MAG: hypothetical protein ABW190_10670, partial [Rhizobacter sp.]